MNKAERKQRVYSNSVLQECLRLEPEISPLLKHAVSIQDCSNRWPLYERFKRCAKQLVGYDARVKELQTSTHYEIMMWALDVFLPETSEEGDTPDPEDFYDEIERIEMRVGELAFQRSPARFINICAVHGWHCRIDGDVVHVSLDGENWKQLGAFSDIERLSLTQIEALLIALEVQPVKQEQGAKQEEELA